MDDDTRRARGAAFSAVADVYERTRPSYPGAAVEWLVGPEPRRVLELGAGTGKLTRSLVARGHTVVATDPSSRMLQELVRTGPGVRTAVAGAERLPFAAQSFDVVVVAQAFHWFDSARALPEVARVLRPQGTLSVTWNLRDNSVPWVRRLSVLLHGSGIDYVAEVDAIRQSPLFGDVQSTRHRFWQQLDLDGLLGLVQSRSNVALLGDGERRQLFREVEGLYAEYGRSQQGMRLPYITHSFRTRVLPPARPDPDPPGGNDDGNLLFDFR